MAYGLHINFRLSAARNAEQKACTCSAVYAFIYCFKRAALICRKLKRLARRYIYACERIAIDNIIIVRQYTLLYQCVYSRRCVWYERIDVRNAYGGVHPA